MPRLSSSKKLRDNNQFGQEQPTGYNTDSGRGENVFLTGGTGFLGELIIKRYLERTNCKLWVLSRASKGASAKERVLDRVNPREHHRIRIVEGNLGKKLEANSGGPAVETEIIDTSEQETYDNLMEMIISVDEIFHNASYLGLKKNADERKDCVAVNVTGTKKLLNLIKTFRHKPKALFYTSTAFVHGKLMEPDIFGEDDALANGWHNPYEESKWNAEKVIRNSGYPYRIFRPGIIARELGAGMLSTHTMYTLADILESGYKFARAGQSEEQIHIKVKGIADATHNIILRSELADMIFDIRASHHEMNHIYNTINPMNTRFEDVVYAILNSLDPTITCEFVPDIAPDQSLTRIEGLLKKVVYPLYEEYLFKKSPGFRMGNVKEALGEEYVTRRVTRLDRSLLTTLMADYFQTKHVSRLRE